MVELNCTCAAASAGMVAHKTCSVAGCDGKHKSNGLCAKHYMQSKRKGLSHYSRRIKCSYCGDEFEPANASAMYCSNRCKVAAWHKSNPVKSHELAKRKKKPQMYCAVKSGYCLCCGKPYCKKSYSTYCSVECQRFAELQRGKLAARIVYAKRYGAGVKCEICGDLFIPSYSAGTGSKVCSSECSKSLYRALGKSAMKRRSARIIENGYEKVDPFKVFERDKWRCKLCGTKTPKSKRGSYCDNAPELDHIIPVSKGGPHTYANTQCACRKCNGLKSDKPMGQMLLIG